jgi:hypothetical protein
LRSWIVVLIFSSSWSQCWTYWSSSSYFHSYVSLSNKSTVALTYHSIWSMCLVSSFFLCSFTSKRVVGMSCSWRFSISYLYWSIVFTIWSIFCVVQGPTIFTLFKILS